MLHYPCTRRIALRIKTLLLMKRISYKISFIFIVCVLCNFGCSKSKEACELVNFAPIDWQQIKDYQVIDNKWEDKFLVINSQQELDAQLIPGPLSDNTGFKNIDFITNTLLIGKKALGNGAGQLLSQQVNHICESDKYVYEVIIKDGGYTVLTKFYFGVLVPKKDAASVVFDVKVIK